MRRDLRDALDRAQADGRIKDWWSNSPGDGATRYHLEGHGIVNRTYKGAAKVRAFLDSGKTLELYEYPEWETRLLIGHADGKGYFAHLPSSTPEVGRVTPYYRSRERAAQAAVEKEAEYATG